MTSYAMRLPARSALFGAVIFATIAAGCGGEATTGGTVNSKDWAITLTSPRATFSILQGATDTIPLTVTRAGGFTGPITIEVVAGGSTLGFSQSVVNISTTGATTTAQLVVGVPGSYPSITNMFFVHAFSPTDAVQESGLQITMSVTRKPGIFITAPTSMFVVAGQSTSTRIGFSRTQFTDPVSFTLNTPPAGVTATFTPNPVVSDSSTNMLLSADATVPVGTYSIGVRSNAGLASQATAPVSLTVGTSNPVSATLAPASLTLARGAVGTTQVTVNRGPYTGGISFLSIGRPSGITDGFNPSPVTGNSSVYTVTVGASTTPGTYTITIQVFAAGYPTATAALTVVIQ